MVIQLEPKKSSLPASFPPVRTQPSQPAVNLTPVSVKTTTIIPSSLTEPAFIQHPVLKEFAESYQAFTEKINLKAFRPEKLDQYIEAEEKRQKVQYTPEEKAQFHLMAQSQDPKVLKMLALELHVGVSEELEKKVLQHYGRLVLFCKDEESLQHFAQSPHCDPNLKAHIKTLQLFKKVENAVNTLEILKYRVEKFFRPVSRLFPALSQT